MKKKTLLFIIIVIVIGILSTIIIINQRKPVIEEASLPPQEEIQDGIEKENKEEDSNLEPEKETEKEETEEKSFPARIVTVIQDTIDGIFNKEMKIVAIGDSLTYGVGDSTESGGYVGILDRSINQEKQIANFENLGKPGNRTEQLLKRLDEAEIQESIREADIVLITIGANDIMKVARENITNLEMDDFVAERDLYEERLEKIMEKMHGINSDANIYLLGIYNPFLKYFGDIKELNMIVESWNETGSNIALEKENVNFIPIIDIFNDFSENLFAQDNFHPNNKGYYLISERVLEYISNQRNDQNVQDETTNTAIE